ncbi:MAG TPA: hypothetical protein VD706_01455 [Candidatus Saccharimonadales bacterium]|nr:hypothetical protein [Candidatus Saccharimonadales bacterium]
MDQSLSEVRWAENEVIFRKANESTAKRVASTKTIAQEDGQEEFVKGMDDLPLLFYCECADEKCRERISLTSNEYTEQHRNSSQFIVIPGHHIPKVERVTFDADKYLVIEKYVTPPQDAETLNPT